MNSRTKKLKLWEPTKATTGSPSSTATRTMKYIPPELKLPHKGSDNRGSADVAGSHGTICHSQSTSTGWLQSQGAARSQKKINIIKKKKAQLPKEKKSTQAQEEEETYAVTRQPQELKHTWLHHRQVEVIAFYQPRKCRGLTFCQQILLYCSGALNILNNVKCTSNCNKT